MKVVLKQDVKNIGKKDGMYEVSDGYARNFLFPRKLAVPADAAAVNEVKSKAAAQEHHRAEALAAAQALAARIDGKTVSVKAKAGKEGRLFGSVTAKDIAAAVSSRSSSNTPMPLAARRARSSYWVVDVFIGIPHNHIMMISL